MVSAARTAIAAAHTPSFRCSDGASPPETLLPGVSNFGLAGLTRFAVDIEQYDRDPDERLEQRYEQQVPADRMYM